MHLAVEKDHREQREKLDLKALSCSNLVDDFNAVFVGKMADVDSDRCTLNELNTAMVDAFKHAVDECVPTVPATRHRPWISSATLELIARRGEARRNGENQHC